MRIDYSTAVFALASVVCLTQAYVLHSTNEAHQRSLDEEAILRSDKAFHFYPEAKAFRRVYSCCIYSETNERGLVCDILDDECHEEFRQAMNVYYIVGLVLIFMMFSSIAFFLIHAKVTYNPQVKDAILVKKRTMR